MSKSILKKIAACLVAIGMPMFTVYAATFVGSSLPPPQGNVGGVIWNGTNADGAAIFSSHLYLKDSSSFGVNNPTSTGAVNLQNYVPGSGVSPFKLNVSGELYVNPVSPTGAPGTLGKVQASKYCFSPGTGVSDCITSWANAGSGYVSKTGDTMSGGLTVSVATTTSAIYGINSSSGWGGVFSSPGTSLKSSISSSGSSASSMAVQGDATANGYGGYFQGKATGVYGNGATGGYFTNNAYYVTPAVAMLATGPLAGDFSSAGNGVGDTSDEVLRATYTGSAGSAIRATGGSGGGIIATGYQAGTFNGSNVGVSGDGSVGGVFTGSTKGLMSTTNSGSAGVFQTANGLALDLQGKQGINLLATTYALKATNGTGGAYLGVPNCPAPNPFYGLSLNNTDITANCTSYNLLSGTGTNQHLFLNRPLSYDMYFRENNADQMTIKTGGNVGIGTTAPTSKLTVSGTMNVTGDITAPAVTVKSCAWTAFVSETTGVTCPATAPFASGYKTSGTTISAYCCQL